MTALQHAMSPVLSLRGAYRDEASHDEKAISARHKTAAADALAMALLTLGNSGDGDRGDTMHRVEQARGFLVEAVTALSRARLYDPRIRTHALPVLLDSANTAEGELSRLHQIATRLLWQNHAHLPARLQATPLEPEEEAQLAVVLRGLARHNRIGRVMRRRWVMVALTAAVSGPLMGAPMIGAAMACVAITLGVFGK